jgi:hypothetical protein
MGGLGWGCYFLENDYGVCLTLRVLLDTILEKNAVKKHTF